MILKQAKKHTVRSFFGMLCMLLVFSSLSAQNFADNFIDGRLYVRFTAGVPESQTLALFSKYRATYRDLVCEQPFRDLGSAALDRTWQLRFSDYRSTDTFISQLKEEKQIELVEQCPLYKISYTPNDPVLQWHLTKVKADSAWDLCRGNKRIKIAIIDNGVLTSHEDLKNQIWFNDDEIPDNGIDDDLNGYADDIHGYDVADMDNNPNPPAGINGASIFNHGTHCAGVAAGTTDNATGIKSLAFNASIIPVKCTASESSGLFLTASINGVTYAMRNAADVISMSYASTGYASTDQEVFAQALTKGCILIAAAGNENSQEKYYPAAYSGVIAVGSTGKTDLKSSFSNTGSYVDVMAPGEDIYSTFATSNSAYATMNGTSMAAPLVASLAALIKARNYSLKPWEVENIIKSTCDDISALNPTFTGKIGTGRINAYKALQKTQEKSFEPAQGISLFPNPFRDIINIDPGSSSFSDVMITVYDISGRKMFEQTHDLTGKIIISLKGMSPGYYIINFSKDGSVIQRTRLVKI